MEGVLPLRGGLILKFLGFHCQYSPGVVPFFVIRTVFLMLERQGLTYDELFCFFFVIAIQKKMRFSGMPTITNKYTLDCFDILQPISPIHPANSLTRNMVKLPLRLNKLKQSQFYLPAALAAWSSGGSCWTPVRRGPLWDIQLPDLFKTPIL